MNHTDHSRVALLAEIADHLRVLSGFFHDLACRADHLSRTTSPYPYPDDVSGYPDTMEDDPPF
jgi:hypothetical protein